MDIVESMKNTLELESQGLMEVHDSFDTQTAAQIVQLLKDCKGKIILSACGTSGMAARKTAHTLNVVACPAMFMSPADAVHGGLGFVQENDLLILISKGGETNELIPIERVARKKAVKIIAVTENEDSELAKQADYILKIKISREPDEFNLMATGSTLAVISMFDAICIAIARSKGYRKEDLALIHPGGAVGKRLIGKMLYE